MDRLQDLLRFYAALDRLAGQLGGPSHLDACSGRRGWPERGVYFFFEPGEQRSNSGIGQRVVRVGTHAVTSGSRTSLWQRLSQHRGSVHGSGNHRGSIFRSLVGATLQRAGRVQQTRSWALKPDLRQAAGCLDVGVEELRVQERPVEVAVSAYIGAMPFLWVDVPDQPSPESQRSVVERGSIALLSNWQKPPIDPPSASWLGSMSSHERVRLSGLWNNRHVDEIYDPAFLDMLDDCVEWTRPTKK
jgi:hypothetical protein